MPTAWSLKKYMSFFGAELCFWPQTWMGTPEKRVCTYFSSTPLSNPAQGTKNPCTGAPQTARVKCPIGLGSRMLQHWPLLLNHCAMGAIPWYHCVHCRAIMWRGWVCDCSREPLREEVAGDQSSRSREPARASRQCLIQPLPQPLGLKG